MFENLQPLLGMRPAEYDKRQVKCLNASLIGGGAYTARVNDFVLYRGASNELHLGRMIGRVRYAPGWTNDNSELSADTVQGHILSLTLSNFGDSAMIRWVNPAHVLQIARPDKGRELFAEFYFAERLPFNLNELCRLSYHGTLSASYYTKEHATEVIQTQNDRLKAAGYEIPKI